MRQKPEGINSLFVKMDRDDQAIRVPANVEYNHRFAAVNFYHIRARIKPSQIGEISPGGIPHRCSPRGQIFIRLGMLAGHLAEKAFLDDPHAYNLYSKILPVKENTPLIPNTTSSFSSH